MADSIVKAREAVMKQMFQPPARGIETNADLLRGIDPELQQLICNSDSELIDLALASEADEEIDIFKVKPTRPLSQAESDHLNSELLVAKMFGSDGMDTVGVDDTLLEKLAPRDPLKEMIARAIGDVVAAAKRGDLRPLDVIRAPEVRDEVGLLKSSGIASKPMRELLEVANQFDPDSIGTQFLKCYAAGDQSGMRAVVRELLAA